jgi:hypothetical protein
VTRVSREWLALREPADAEARASELVDLLPAGGPHLVHDLGSGTGAMGRWLAPRLTGPQHWVLHDRDADLLNAASLPDGVTFETRTSDVTRLQPDDLAGATLITASALLDMLSERELAGLLAACADAPCPALLTMTVVGRVDFAPADPLDRRLEAAFNDHQRRTTIGPDAVAALERSGTEAVVRPSPWRLGRAHAELLAEWFTGWHRAACEQEPDLAATTEDYARRRLEQAAAGQLAVTVAHADVLLPNRGESA